MSQTPIEIVDYDPSWVEAYEAERDAILAAVGDHLEAVEHVGSTAVPGLAAKPIIDLQGGVADLAEADACVEGLEAIGYEYCPEFEDQVPQRRYFRKTAGGDHTHHLHVVPVDSDWWERHLLFRDYLRDHPQVAREYESLKRGAAQAHRDDVGAYTDAKDEFIREVEQAAREFYDRD